MVDLLILSFLMLIGLCSLAYIYLAFYPLLSQEEHQKIVSFGNQWLAAHRSQRKFRRSPSSQPAQITVQEYSAHDLEHPSSIGSCSGSGNITLRYWPKDYLYPNCRYTVGVVVLAHELGHAKLLNRYRFSDSGYDYPLTELYSHQTMIRKEELLAWVVGFGWLWNFPISLAKKLMLFITAGWVMLYCFGSYCDPNWVAKDEVK